MSARIMQFEGHRYYVAPSAENPALAEFRRDPALDFDAPEKIGWCSAAELAESGDGWCYLPCRIALPIAEHPLRDQVRAHPLYLAGRDDLAIAALEATPYAPAPFVPPAPYTPDWE